MFSTIGTSKVHRDLFVRNRPSSVAMMAAMEPHGSDILAMLMVLAGSEQFGLVVAVHSQIRLASRRPLVDPE